MKAKDRWTFVVGIMVVAVVAGALFVPLSAQGGGRITVTERFGPDKTLGPFQSGEAVARCPRGYYASGGGVYSGAIEMAYDGPTTDNRGWDAGGLNTSFEDSYSFSVLVECVKGASGLRVRAALSAAQKREALAALRERVGR